ncbi:MAG: S8 family serine peptidase, partial [Aggregatilineales bacterium]
MDALMQLKFPFISNYPHYKENAVSLLSTPERVDAHPDYTGKGVTIAFVDSGFSNHPAIVDRIRLHVDASTQHIMEQPKVVQTGIASWHGQMTSVIAAGNGCYSEGKYRGIASESDLILIKVSTPDFRIKEPDILRGLRWIYDTRHRHNIRVVNCSVGGDFPSQNPDHPLHRIVRRLTEAGIVVVVASGNRGRDSLVPPASAPEAVIVGGYDDQNSLNRDDWTCFHHNYGSAYDGTPKPDLLAPANWLASPFLPDSETAAEVEVLAKVLHAQSESEVMTILQTGYETLQLTEAEIEVM